MKNAILALVTVVTALPALAVPDLVTYAARVENDAGPFDGTVSIAFQIFDARTAGVELWSESVVSAVVVAGDLVHDLGSVEALDDALLDRDELFLAVTINGDTLSPRAALRAVPFALRAKQADVAASLDGLSADDVATDDEVAAAVAARVVAFNQLTGVPTDLADGDNDTIATAGAGGGLKAVANAFSIDDNAITLARMGDSSVGAAEIVNESLTSEDLGPASVGSSEITDNSITSADVFDGTLTAADLATSSVGTSEILDNTISSVDVLDESLTSGDLGPASVGTSEITDNSITSADVFDGTLTAADLATGSVGTSEILDNTISSADLGSASVNTSELAADAVSRSKIDGEEVELLLTLNACTEPGVLSIRSTCNTASCNIGGLARFLDCNGTCNQNTPATCPNISLGFLLAPDGN